MYVYIRRIGSEFFEAVCLLSSATAYLSDPPPVFQSANRLREC